MKFLLPVFAMAAVALFAGCVSTSQQLNSLHIGMTKPEVVAIMGQPDSTSAQGNIEYYTYYLATDDYYRNQPYLVRFSSGIVESFGRFAQLNDLYNRPVVGGPQGNPGMNPMLVNPLAGGPMVAPPAPDLAAQLTQLKALKDQGVLTDAEFQQAKQKLLAAQP